MEKGRTFRQIVKKIFSPLRENKSMKNAARKATIHPFFSSITGIGIVEISRRLIDNIEQGVTNNVETYLYTLILIVVTYLIVRILTKNYGYAQLRPAGYKYFYQKFLGEYIELSNSEVSKIGTGKAQHIIETGTKSRTLILSETIVRFSGYITRIALSLVVIFSISRQYGIIFVAFLAFLIATYVWTQYKANNRRRKRKIVLVDWARDVVRIIMSKYEVLQSGKIKNELEKYSRWHHERLGFNKNVETWRLVSEGCATIMLDGLRILTFVTIVYGIRGGISLGDFAALLMIINILGDVTWSISRYYIDVSKEFISVEKVRDLFDDTPTIQGYNSGIDFIHHHGSLVLDHISFSYDSEGKSTVFSNLSLTIPGGSKTALVGPSGGGKSTIIKLIAGYLRPDSGSVIVDDQDLAKVSLKSYYKHIGYLTQEPSVFDGTVWDNLTYAMDTSTDGDDAIMEKVKEAITDAQCEFIWDLPDGLQTEIGERGVRLSGGQRQRLAIAKIFLKDPEIVLLDEPTSALDSQSEEAVTIAMNRLFEGRTVIVIAHRLQTVKHADGILYIEDGKVVEEGNHTELMKEKGKYYTMVELQSGF